uniref:Uncharacterized protein n=1 Tax=Tetraselmis sp. GSL018 TaxID=582737 RepID=A0A061SB88_9CHLO
MTSERHLQRRATKEFFAEEKFVVTWLPHFELPELLTRTSCAYSSGFCIWRF